MQSCDDATTESVFSAMRFFLFLIVQSDKKIGHRFIRYLVTTVRVPSFQYYAELASRVSFHQIGIVVKTCSFHDVEVEIDDVVLFVADHVVDDQAD